MPLIPTRHVEPRETVALRFDRGVHERLQQYADFIQSPKEYVVAQALQRLFRSDKEFTTWLASHPGPTPASQPDGITPDGATPAVPDTTSGALGGTARARRAGRRSGPSAPREQHTQPRDPDHREDEADGEQHVPQRRSVTGPRDEG
jgi:hypothetical protein